MAKRKSRFLTFLFGIFFGIILTVGSVAGGAYWAYNYLSIQKAEELSGQNISFLDDLLVYNSSIKTMAIKELVAEANSALELSVEQLSEKYGLSLSGTMGIFYTVLKDIKVRELPSGIISIINDTPEMTFSAFSGKYPDLIPENLMFLVDALPDVKIKDTFDNIDVLLSSTMLGTLLGSPYNQDPEIVDPPEGAEYDDFLWELRTYKLGADSDKPITSLPDNITVMRFEQLFKMEIPTYLMSEEDKQTTMLSGLSDTLNELTFVQLLDEPDADDETTSAKIIRKILALTVYDEEMLDDERYPGGMRPYRVSEMDDMFAALTDTLTMDVFLSSPSEEGLTKIIIDKLISDPTATVNTLPDKLSDIVDELKFSDVFDIDEDNLNNPGDRILAELKDEFIKDAGSALNNLTLQAVLGSGDTGEDSNIGERIIYALATGTNDYNQPYTISEIDSALSNLYLKDIFNSGSADGDIGDRIIYAITRQQDPLDPDSFFKLDELDQALNALTVGVIFPEPDPANPEASSGIARLLSSDDRAAPISDIDNIVLSAIMNSPLDNLVAAGIISNNMGNGTQTLNDIFNT